jgi:hypothetical protein
MAIEQPQQNDETVTDGASTTEHYSGEDIANGAADALHGERANVEKYEQGDAVALESRTLIGDGPVDGDAEQS